MLEDLRVAIRTLLKTPAFTLTTLAVLALGIGANTAIFGVVSQVLLSPPGIANPERVVAVRARYEKLNLSSISLSAPDFRDVQNGTGVFEAAAVLRQTDYNYSAGDVPERLRGANVSTRWFDVFGATPYLGRPFKAEEDQPGANTSVVLAHATWLRVFGGDPSVVGRTITLNSKPYKVVGVMKADFRWPRQVDLWVPLGLPAVEFTEDYRFNENLTSVARLRPGVSFDQANAYIRLAADRTRNATDDNARFARDARWGMFAIPFTDFTAGNTRTPVLVLMGAVAFVLLIACSNVAGLMVARTAGRVHEISLRSALGATRWQLLRQTLAESIVLAVGGAALGVALAAVATRLLLVIAPPDAAVGLSTRIDLTVLLFTLGCAALCALLAAAAPAWQAAALSAFDHIKGGGRQASGRPRQRLRAALVVSQVALALVLLVGAGLLLRSLARLQEVRPGFEPRGVMTAMLTLPRAQYESTEKQVAFYRAVTERLATITGVSLAAAGSPLPFSGEGSSASFGIEGRVVGPGDPGPHGNIRLVTPRYFAALGIPLKSGRLFSDDDRADTAPVVVVDENLARQYWPGENPVGRHMRNGGPKDPWATIIGVVGHVKHDDLATDPAKGTYYYSMFQQPQRMAGLVIKASGAAADAGAAGIREAVRGVDPGLPVHTIRSMEDMVSSSLAPRRFVMRLLTFFAAIALAMAALGLYAVISYSVTQRTAEIGVRMALGAPRGRVMWLMVGQGLRLAALGAVLGAAAAMAGSRVIASQLFGISPFDPLTFAVMTMALLGAALLASYVPARRATRIDPLVALRTE